MMIALLVDDTDERAQYVIYRAESFSRLFRTRSINLNANVSRL